MQRPHSGEKPRIFISYARRDDEEPFEPARSFVLRIFNDLSARGFDVWLDRLSMPSRQLVFSQEIRDAIAERDRVLLVIGPGALKSTYVTQEWKYALERADKAVTPILRVGEYSLLPEELRAFQCEDFRDDRQYERHFENLVRQLSEFPPPLGNLFDVPPLPPFYITRRIQSGALLDVSPGAIGVSGMGGIGKSVIANAIARDQRIRRAFPDGIVWITLGTHRDLVALQQRVHRLLGGDGGITSIAEGRQKLKEAAREKRLLLVLDDAWQRGDIECFNGLAPRSTVLVTTRDRGLLAAAGIQEQHIETMPPPDARRLLARHTAIAASELPGEAEDVLRMCAGLPLAIALCGGMIRVGESWQDVAGSLRERELELIAGDHPLEEKHRTLEAALQLSVETLGKEEQRRFAELAAFPGAVPEHAVLVLWLHTGGLRVRHARKLLRQLEQRSLLQLRAHRDTDSVVVSRHDLVHDLSVRIAREQIGDDTALHTSVVEAYRRVAGAGWWTGPNDGYFFSHLAGHLQRSGRIDELADLLHRLEWLEAKNENELTYELLRDYSTALQELRAGDARIETLELLDRALRRDVHFIARHARQYPQALFQCLWNTCWWEDTSALASLLESWRPQKEQRTPGFRWLRSLQPPVWPLRSALIRKLPIDSVPSHAHGIVFSPSDRLMAFEGSLAVYVFDAESGARIGFIDRGDFYAPYLAFSRDELALCGIGYESQRDAPKRWEVRTWRIDDGICIARTFLEGEVESFARDRAGDCVALGMHDGFVRVVRVHDAQQIAEKRIRKKPPAGLAFSSVRGWLAIAYPNGTLLITDSRMSVVKKFGITKRCHRIAFVRDTETLAVAAAENLSLWDCAQGVRLKEFTFRYEHRFTFSADGTRVASAGPASIIRVWVVDTGEPVNQFMQIFDFAWDVALSSDGGRVLFGTQAATKLLVTEGMPLDDLPGRHILPAYLAISPDGSAVVTGAENGAVWMFDPGTGSIGGLGGFDMDVDRVQFSPGGRWLLTCCGNISLFHVPASSMVLWSKRGQWGMNDWPNIWSAYRAAFSADERFLAAVGEKDGSIRIWDLEKQTESVIPCSPGNSHVAVALSSDATLVIAALEDGTVVRHPGAEECFRYPGRVRAIACSPGGRMVAAAGENCVLLQRPDSVEILRIDDQPFRPRDLHFSSDGGLTARGEHRLIRWRVADARLVQSVDTAIQTIVRSDENGETALWMHPAPLKEVDLSLSGRILAGFDDERYLMVLALEGGTIIPGGAGQEGSSGAG